MSDRSKYSATEDETAAMAIVIGDTIDDIARLRAELARVNGAIRRGGMDISLCMECAMPVVTLPDGLTLCEDCAGREGGE